MAVRDFVGLLVDYLHRGKKEFKADRGSRAAIIAENVLNLLEENMQDQDQYQALWRDFTRDPQDQAPDLTGALEALIEADPGLGEDIDHLVTDYHQAVRQGEGDSVKQRAEAEEILRSLPESDVPLGSGEIVPREAAADVPRGSFLYGGGDLEAGDITAGEVTEQELDRQEQPVLKGGSIEKKLIFDQLRSTLQEQSGLSEKDRYSLGEVVNDLEAELLLGQDANPNTLEEQLRSIQQVSPRFFRYLERGLFNNDYFQIQVLKDIFNRLENNSYRKGQ